MKKNDLQITVPKKTFLEKHVSPAVLSAFTSVESFKTIQNLQRFNQEQNKNQMMHSYMQMKNQLSLIKSQFN